MSTHRVPPKPHYFDSAPLGTCRWCNVKIADTPTGKPSKARWHPRCVTEYKLLFWPTNTRRAVRKRDNGICAACGIQCTSKGVTKWHMDHIKPLIEAQGDMNYWKLPNLQTLCTDCHKAKTSQEATERATKRKLMKDQKPTT